MYIVIYSFEVAKGKHDEFVESWKTLTNLIKEYAGGLGSRLHKKNDNKYIAYAQWPDKKTFENAGSKLPEKAIKIRDEMKAAGIKVTMMEKLEVVEDLLI